MLKDVIGIKVIGGNFESLTELDLLDSSDGTKTKLIKGSILYGRNGSGKSTIAKAVKKIISGTNSHIIYAEMKGKDTNVISLTDDEKNRVFVFDEEFVDENVKLQEDGLNTIVMLGQQADLANQIIQAQMELDIVSQELEEQNRVILDEFENQSSSKSPKYYINQMRSALQGDNNWAGRDKEIKGGRQNTGVKDDTYKQFLNLSPTKSRDELIILFNEKIKELRQAQKGDATIKTSVPTVTLNYDDVAVKKLLSIKIEKPVLSEREKYLLQLVQNGGSDLLVKMLSTFEKEDTKKCPYCLQPLEDEYKKNLTNSIQKVLSKIVEEHQQALQKLIVTEVEVDLSMFVKLGDKKNNCENIIECINQRLRDNNSKLQQKRNDPYTPIEIEVSTVDTMLDSLNKALEELEEERLEFNKKVQATEPIKKELIKINNEIAYYDIKSLFHLYKTQQDAYREAKQKQIEKQNICLQKKNVVEELEAERKNIRIALEVINNSLKYIFFSENRLKIEYQKDTYILLSNGHAVKPSDISLGERNIIALCYFFTTIMQNKEVSTIYDREYLIIIDDPVSSFDIENKVGIMSFLKYQLEKFLLGNIDTKAIIMTHDLQTFYDLNKIFDELIENCKEKFQGKNLKFNRLELKQQSLKTFEYKNRQEYTELIKTIYNYALGNASEYEIVIGNMIRQSLEAFSTFQYKKGIEKVSTDNAILNSLSEEYKSYFSNLMYRLVLHGGSHREEQVKALDNMNFFSVISSKEKRRTARDVLCFIYLLNSKHLTAHLKDCGEDAILNLDKWCNDIKKMAAV